VALASREGPLDRAAFLGALTELVHPVDRGVAAAIGAMAGWRELAPAAALRALRRQAVGEESGWGWERDGGIPVHVIPSVLWSLYAFLRAPDDYWETICTAIWPGGDTDTTAAMAGALSGARVGPDALPRDLLGALHDRGKWGAEALAALANECDGI
jgi:hypothetical protein